MKQLTCLDGLFTAVLALVAANSFLPQANAQPIVVPQSAPYTSDAHTVLLEHFDGTTSGSPSGSVTYTNGVFGQGVHMNIGSWVSWNLGALSQATVEFWGKLDASTFATYGDSPAAFLMQSDYGQFFAQTFVLAVFTNGVWSDYDCDCGAAGGNWVGMDTGGNPNPRTYGPTIRPNVWHHYATTWGSQGFHYYLDGMLVYSNANTYGQSGSTGFWAIGGLAGGGPASGPGFTGMIDELRISNIQRTFTAAPQLAIETAALRLRWVAESNTLYQVQWSSDFQTWSNQTTILGNGSETNIIEWIDGSRNFYRLTVLP